MQVWTKHTMFGQLIVATIDLAPGAHEWTLLSMAVREQVRYYEQKLGEFAGQEDMSDVIETWTKKRDEYQAVYEALEPQNAKDYSERRAAENE